MQLRLRLKSFILVSHEALPELGDQDTNILTWKKQDVNRRGGLIGLINAHTDLSQAKPRSGKAAAARWPSGIYR